MSNGLIGRGLPVAGERDGVCWTLHHPPLRPRASQGSVTFTVPLGLKHSVIFVCGYLLLVLGLVVAIAIGGIFFFV